MIAVSSGILQLINTSLVYPCLAPMMPGPAASMDLQAKCNSNPSDFCLENKQAYLTLRLCSGLSSTRDCYFSTSYNMTSSNDEAIRTFALITMYDVAYHFARDVTR